MSDHVSDTPVMTRYWCPTCEPTVDVTRECVEARYCTQHTPDSSGVSDHVVNTDYVGSSEAGGADNIAWCAILHRGRK